MVLALNVLENNALAIRLVDRQTRILLQLSDLNGTARTLTDERHQLPVEFVDLQPPVCDVHVPDVLS